MTTCDTIIVVGGSPGPVLAHRLSARSVHQVLPREAGQGPPHGKMPAEILDSSPARADAAPRKQQRREAGHGPRRPI